MMHHNVNLAVFLAATALALPLSFNRIPCTDMAGRDYAIKHGKNEAASVTPTHKPLSFEQYFPAAIWRSPAVDDADNTQGTQKGKQTPVEFHLISPRRTHGGFRMHRIIRPPHSHSRTRRTSPQKSWANTGVHTEFLPISSVQILPDSLHKRGIFGGDSSDSDQEKEAEAAGAGAAGAGAGRSVPGSDGAAAPVGANSGYPNQGNPQPYPPNYGAGPMYTAPPPTDSMPQTGAPQTGAPTGMPVTVSQNALDGIAEAHASARATGKKLKKRDMDRETDLDEEEESENGSTDWDEKMRLRKRFDFSTNLEAGPLDASFSLGKRSIDGQETSG